MSPSKLCVCMSTQQELHLRTAKGGVGSTWYKEGALLGGGPPLPLSRWSLQPDTRITTFQLKTPNAYKLKDLTTREGLDREVLRGRGPQQVVTSRSDRGESSPAVTPPSVSASKVTCLWDVGGISSSRAHGPSGACGPHAISFCRKCLLTTLCPPE